MDPTAPEWRRLLAEGAAGLHVHLSEHQTHQFARYAVELLHWNRRTNLTAITDPLAVLAKHFLDSLAALPLLPPVARLLDIGSGGGFPGIPLKIANPQLAVHLVEASRKKVSFQKHLIRCLALEGIYSEQRRLEAPAGQALVPGGFDVVVSRAVADLPVLAAWASPQLAGEGLLVVWRGRPDPRQDGEAGAVLARAGGTCQWEQVPYRLPGVEAERHMVLFRLRPPSRSPSAAI